MSSKQKVNIRSAINSCSGYIYQHVRLINLLFTKYYNVSNLDNIKFREEGDEDIDIWVGEQRYLYQEKYLNGEQNESLTKNSGLTKVLISHYDKKDIVEINYELVSSTENLIKLTNTLEYFKRLIHDATHNYMIGKFIVLIYCNKDFVRHIHTITYDEFIDKLKEAVSTKSMIDDTFMCDRQLKNKNDESKNDESKVKTKNKMNGIKTIEEMLEDFCSYCFINDNHVNLLNYLKKLNIVCATNINDNNSYTKIYKETIDALDKNNVLWKFVNKQKILSDQYKEFHNEMLYGLFNTLLIENILEQNGTTMSMTELINKAKEIYKKSKFDDDPFTLLTHAIRSNINNNDASTKMFNVNNIIDKLCILLCETKGMNINKFISKLCNSDTLININEMSEFIRKVIQCLCFMKKYEFANDPGLISFLLRSNKNELHYVRKKYSSLDKFNAKIFMNGAK